MRKVVASPRLVLLARVSVACVLAASLSACSSDSARLSENPFSNPFSSSTVARGGADPVATGSIGKASGTTGTGLLGSPVTSAPLPPVAARPLASAAVTTPRAPVTTGSLARPAAVVGSAAGWSAAGGTPVTMAHGESVDTLSGRYGVPASAILAANGLSGSARPTPGTKIIIPVYNAAAKSGGHQVAQASSFSSDTARTTPTPAAPVTSAVEGAKEKARLAAEAKSKSEAEARIQAAEARAAAAEARAKADQQARVAAEERAAGSAKARTATDSTAKAQAVKTAAEAKAKSDATGEKLKLAAEKAKAAEKTKAEDKAKGIAEAKAKAEAKALADARTKAEARALAESKAKPGAKLAAAPAPVPVEEPRTTSSVAKEEPAKAPAADFRWPARGRVINGFSGKGGNEGINIAVPEGTPVKAAEGGVVAYSGNELKGYGNLVLIRHDNGYVSAYAHNGDINVKRGEKVTRGQTIAKSGQSGNVSSPQLHFELRKGSSPVDPIPYLEN